VDGMQQTLSAEYRSRQSIDRWNCRVGKRAIAVARTSGPWGRKSYLFDWPNAKTLRRPGVTMGGPETI